MFVYELSGCGFESSCSHREYNFSTQEDPISLLKAIKDGEISLEEARDRQKNYLQYLNIIRKGYKNSVQKRTLANIENHFNARERECNKFY